MFKKLILAAAAIISFSVCAGQDQEGWMEQRFIRHKVVEDSWSAATVDVFQSRRSLNSCVVILDYRTTEQASFTLPCDAVLDK